MTRDQTKNLFKRIKAHYPEFHADEFKIDEWYKELKPYDYEDVTSRFELHLNSEEYGPLQPKLWYLKKGLKTIDEKKESKVFKNPVTCQICNKSVDLRLYEAHYSKCSAIDYMIRETKRIFKKDITREQLEKMTDDEFRNKYDTLLSIIQKNPSFSGQVRIIDTIFNKNTNLDVKEVISSL